MFGVGLLLGIMIGGFVGVIGMALFQINDNKQGE